MNRCENGDNSSREWIVKVALIKNLWVDGATVSYRAYLHQYLTAEHIFIEQIFLENKIELFLKMKADVQIARQRRFSYEMK